MAKRSVNMTDQKGVVTTEQSNPKAVDYVGNPVDGTRLHDNNMITIHSSFLNCVIQSPIQDNISVHTSTEWSQLSVTELSDRLNTIVPALFGTSLKTTFLSRRRWSGSTPMMMKLKLKFMLYDDVLKNVILPTFYLQQMNLPYMGTRSKATQKLMDGVKSAIGVDLPFLAPPSRNPWSISNTAFQNAPKGGMLHSFQNKAAQADEIMGKGDIITIQYGNFMSITNCVFSGVTVNYDSQMTPEGYPIGAEVNINFQTYEIMTKESMAGLLMKKPVPLSDEFNQKGGK